MIELHKIESEDRTNYKPLLLLADESEEILASYLQEGILYSIQLEGETIGAALFIEIREGSLIELKNIALLPKFRGRGFGKIVMNEAFRVFKIDGYERMVVGTANSSIGNIAFYQKVGFRMSSIRKDFFADYPTPIFEDGIQAMDMIVFEKILR